jgi:hypothetical protein
MLGDLAPRAVERAGRDFPWEDVHDALLLLSPRQSRGFLLRRKMLMRGFGCEEMFTMARVVVARPDPQFSCGAEKGPRDQLIVPPYILQYRPHLRLNS